MPTRADTHDLDKLKRWQKDLETTPDDAPAVYAIFLVSEADTAAHNIFRAFRTSFEERQASFAHLVISASTGYLPLSGPCGRNWTWPGTGCRCWYCLAVMRMMGQRLYVCRMGPMVAIPRVGKRRCPGPRE